MINRASDTLLLRRKIALEGREGSVAPVVAGASLDRWVFAPSLACCSSIVLLLELFLSICPLGVGGLVVPLLLLLCPTTIPFESEFPLLLLLRLGDGLLPMLPLRLPPSAVAVSVVQLLFALSVSFMRGLLSVAVPGRLVDAERCGIDGEGDAGVTCFARVGDCDMAGVAV